MSNRDEKKITSTAAADTFISRETGCLTFFMPGLRFTEETEEKDDFKGHKQNSRLRQTSLRVWRKKMLDTPDATRWRERTRRLA